MLNKTLKAVTILTLVLGVIVFLPALIFCALTATDYAYSFLFVIIFCLTGMFVFPIPVYIILRRESRLVEKIKERVGGKCFVGKVAFIDIETGRGTNCYLCFNDDKLLIIAKAGKLTEYLALTKPELQSISIDPDSFDMTIRLVSNRTYKLFSPDPKVTAALEKLGWRVIETSEKE